MPLYDIGKGVREIDPDVIEDWDVLKKAKRIYKAEFDEMVEIVDKEINSLRPSTSSNLTWTKAGAMFGYGQKVAAIDKIWDHAINLWGPTKIPLLFVGSLLMWRIAVRDETWLTVATEKGEVDPDTGKEITERSYWINEDFVYKPHATAQDLMAKFNRRK